MSTKKKLIVAVACLLVATCSLVTGTLAWLTTKTETVTNTFTSSDINITLAESNSNLDTDDNANTNSYKMIPGATIDKDPEVTVLANSEDCYLFVKIDETPNGWENYIGVTLADNTTATFKSYISYDLADGWTALEDVPGVYYRTVAASDNDQSFDVLKDNKVTVSGANVTKGMMEALHEDGVTLPTLQFTAYAVQQFGFNTAAEAWAEAEKLG